jgi:hypothetical protein
MRAFAICCRLLTMCLALHLAPQTAEAATGAKLAGIAFVDSSVTSQGSLAQLPAGAEIYPSGSEITGTTGCPTTPYRTDGLIVAVIDYDGPPTAAALAVIRHPASGGRFENAPYHIDLNAGRTLQYLGPIFENGSYEIHMTWGFAGAQSAATQAAFTLARQCP